MAPPFSTAEYEERQARTRHAVADRGLDVIVIGDPSNIDWLTGYDAWSFYPPQVLVLGLEIGPVWIGRLMDAGAEKFTTYLTAEQVVPFPGDLVQRPDTHPAVFVADWLGKAESTKSGSAIKAMSTISRLQCSTTSRTGCRMRSRAMQTF